MVGQTNNKKTPSGRLFDLLTYVLMVYSSVAVFNKRKKKATSKKENIENKENEERNEDKQGKSDQENVSYSEFLKISAWILRLLHKYYPNQTITFVVMSIALEFRSLINVYVLAKLIDGAISAASSGSTIKVIFPYLGLLLLSNVFLSLCSFFRDYASSIIDISSRSHLRRELYKHANFLGIQALEDPDNNNRFFRTRDEIYGVKYFVGMLVRAISNFVGFLVYVVLVFKVSPLIIVIFLIFEIPLYFYDRKFRKRAWRVNLESTDERRLAHSSYYDLVEPRMLQEIFINKSFNFLDKKFMGTMKAYLKTQIDLKKKWFIGNYSGTALSNGAMYLGYLFPFSKLIKGTITVGTTAFQIRVIDQVVSSFRIFTANLGSVFEFSIRFKDAYKLFKTKPAFPDGTFDFPRLKKGPEIKIKNLSFKYPKSDSFVLDDINLTIKSKEKIAIVGHNGAGKTTLVKLLSRIYLPTKGSILVNDINLKNIKAKSYYENTGVLFQDFNRHEQLTVRENVYIGRPDEKFDEQKFVDALKNADAMGFVEKLPNKYDQILTEKVKGGTRLSSGQWQKLAIARFFYRNTPLVIFDEPTAAIDAVSEHNIFNRIFEFFKNKTVILISHRFSTVRNADRIIVLKEGEIIGEGSHEELLEKNGYYAKSFRMQAEGYSEKS